MSSGPRSAESSSWRASATGRPVTPVPAGRSGPHRGSARRRPCRPTPLRDVGRQTREPAPKRGRPIGSHRPDTAVGTPPRPLPTTGSGPPDRSGTGRVPHPNSCRMPFVGRRVAAPEVARADPERRTQLMQPGERELHLRLDSGGARDPAIRRLGARYSNSAVLPTPASPYTTNAWLLPCRIAAANPSSVRRSARRPISPTAVPLSIGFTRHDGTAESARG